MDNTALTAEFWSRGFIVLEDFFAPELMDDFQHYLNAHSDQLPWGRHSQAFIDKAEIDIGVLFPERKKITTFNGVKEDPRLQTLTEAILGPGWHQHGCMIMYSRSGTSGQAWHQDCPPEPGQFNLNRLVYTATSDQQTGGQLCLVPGSHRRGNLPAGQPHQSLAGEITLTTRRGTLVLMHGHCWHRVLAVKAGPRYSFNYRCTPAGVPESILETAIYRNMRYNFAHSAVLEERTADAPASTLGQRIRRWLRRPR